MSDRLVFKLLEMNFYFMFETTTYLSILNIWTHIKRHETTSLTCRTLATLAEGNKSVPF